MVTYAYEKPEYNGVKLYREINKFISGLLTVSDTGDGYVQITFKHELTYQEKQGLDVLVEVNQTTSKKSQLKEEKYISPFTGDLV